MKKSVRGFCAALTAIAFLVSATPSVEAGFDWGSVLGSVIGKAINNSGGSNNSGNNGGNNGGLLGGLSYQKHARPNLTNDEKLFILAVEKNDIGTAQAMLDTGIDIDMVFKSGYSGLGRYQNTPFGIAIINNNRDMMQFLLESGADINGFYDYDNNYCSYFAYAGKFVQKDLLEYLHNWGANINSTDSQWNNNALDNMYDAGHYNNNRFECAKYLLENGINPDNTPKADSPVLSIAVSRADYQMIDVLAAHGANLNIRDRDGRTVLDIALARNDLQLYKYVQEVLARGQQPSRYKEAKAEQAAAASLNDAKKKEVVAYSKHISQAEKLSSKAIKNFLGKNEPVTSWSTQDRVAASKKALSTINDALKEFDNNSAQLQKCTPEEQEKILGWEQGVKDLILKQKQYIDILVMDEPLTPDDRDIVVGYMSEATDMAQSNTEKLQAVYDTLKFKF